MEIPFRIAGLGRSVGTVKTSSPVGMIQPVSTNSVRRNLYRHSANGQERHRLRPCQQWVLTAA